MSRSCTPRRPSRAASRLEKNEASEPGGSCSASAHQTCEKVIRAHQQPAFPASERGEPTVLRTDVLVAGVLAMFGTLLSTASCSSMSGETSSGTSASETNPTCLNGARDGDELGTDCGGSCVTACGSASGGTPSAPGDSPDGGRGLVAVGNPTNGVRDGSETDVDCGGSGAPKCVEAKSCLVDSDCEVGCSYAKKCVSAPSCKTHLGGDTCGAGEVGDSSASHESCCRTLKVPGYSDPAHPGKTVYLDKYEITAGRVRAFIEQLTSASGGQPDVKGWIAKHTPQIWDPAWNAFLPSDLEGGTAIINRRLLGDPRVEDGTGQPGPGVILPPATDELRHMGLNFQFNSELYVDLHGNNCGTFPGSYGFPTYYYPPEILARDGQLPRASGVTASGAPISAKDLLDVKSMNCITNAMLAAFCAWDGGQLATDEVLDFVTDTPASRGNISGCGAQYDNHGELGNNVFTNTVQTGGRCAPVALVNATFDAGDNLPVPNSPLNVHNYAYPDTGNPAHDKAWQVAAPGRASLASGGQTDAVRINPADEPWMDLHGNLNEAALDMSGATFTGTFALKNRGIGYGSSRSDLNVRPIPGESVVRIQRPEAKAAYTGGRCMRFK
jgi:hypothetical protein